VAQFGVGHLEEATRPGDPVDAVGPVGLALDEVAKHLRRALSGADDRDGIGVETPVSVVKVRRRVEHVGAEEVLELLGDMTLGPDPHDHVLGGVARPVARHRIDGLDDEHPVVLAHVGDPLVEAQGRSWSATHRQ